MPKYYIDSGDLKFTCIADNPMSSIEKAFLSSDDEVHIGSVIRVNERGFLKNHGDDIYFASLPLIKHLGLKYKKT